MSTNTNKIWIVTSGNYSDYHIVSVFSSQELADKFAAHDKDRSVEEYEIDLHAEQIRSGLNTFYVRMNRDGDGSVYSRDPDDEVELSLSDTPRAEGRVLYGTVWAEGKQHALKIANEKRAQLIANNEWPTEESK